MHATTCDTRGVARDLETAGFGRHQAVAVVSAIGHGEERAVTKTGLADFGPCEAGGG